METGGDSRRRTEEGNHDGAKSTKTHEEGDARRREGRTTESTEKRTEREVRSPWGREGNCGAVRVLSWGRSHVQLIPFIACPRFLEAQVTTGEKALLNNVLDALDRLFDRQSSVIDLWALLFATADALRGT